MNPTQNPDFEETNSSFTPYATFDYSNLPLIEVDFNEVEATDENFLAYLEELYSVQIKNNYQPVAMLIDMKNASYVSAKYRIMVGKRIKEEEEVIKKYSIATAILTHNLIQNVILKGVFLMSEHPTPLKIFSKKEEAIEWLTMMLEERRKQDSL